MRENKGFSDKVLYSIFSVLVIVFQNQKRVCVHISDIKERKKKDQEKQFVLTVEDLGKHQMNIKCLENYYFIIKIIADAFYFNHSSTLLENNLRRGSYIT